LEEAPPSNDALDRTQYPAHPKMGFESHDHPGRLLPMELSRSRLGNPRPRLVEVMAKVHPQTGSTLRCGGSDVR
jgi:hypothetical protein